MAIMTGKEALMQVLLHEGVEYVFGLPGTSEMPFLDTLEDHPEIKYILCLQECIAVGAAEGYARTSGKVGVVNLHTDAGLTAAMPLLLNSYIGGVPLVITAGYQDTRMLMQEPEEAGNLEGMASHYTKWSTKALHADDIPLAIRRAFKTAMEPPTGPVFILLPTNVMNDSLDYQYVPGAPSFLKLHPDPEAIATALEVLLKAKKPAILVGNGVPKNDAIPEVIKLAELLGARVYQRWMGDVSFPTSHPLFLKDLNILSLASREMLQSVDVLISIGDPLFPQPLYLPKPILTPNTKIVQIDDNLWEIAKNFPVAAGIAGHIKISLTELNDALESRMTASAHKAAGARAAGIAQEKERAKAEFLEEARREKDNVPISLSRLMVELRDALKPGTLFIDDSCSAAYTLRRCIDFDEPKSYQYSRGGGSIGWGLPGPIGVKLAAPDRPVVSLSGDGAAMWAIQSLWTAAHYNLAITFIVADNASYNTLKVMKHLIMGDKAKGRYMGFDFNEPRIDFSQIAQGMGVLGQKVERPEELSGALKSAFNSGKPNLVDVHISGSFQPALTHLKSQA